MRPARALLAMLPLKTLLALTIVTSLARDGKCLRLPSLQEGVRESSPCPSVGLRSTQRCSLRCSPPAGTGRAVPAGCGARGGGAALNSRWRWGLCTGWLMKCSRGCSERSREVSGAAAHSVLGVGSPHGWGILLSTGGSSSSCSALHNALSGRCVPREGSARPAKRADVFLPT